MAVAGLALAHQRQNGLSKSLNKYKLKQSVGFNVDTLLVHGVLTLLSGGVDTF